MGFDNDGNGTVDETVAYEYDAGGLRTKLTLPGSLNIVYTYDARGQLISLTDWSSQKTAFAYDNLGRHIASERHNGLRSTYSYDAGSRLRTLRHSKDNRTLAHFAYEVDKRGNRTQAFEALAQPATTNDTIIAFNDKSLVTIGTWTDVSSFKETTQFHARLMLAFMGDEATLTMGTGPDHSIYDVYVGGSLWQSFDGYAATAGQRDIVITTGIDGRKVNSEGPHIVEIRNRAERHRLSTGYKLRFKQLLVVDRAYTLQTLRYSYDALSRLTEARTAPGVNALASDANLLRRELFAYDRAGNRTQGSIAMNGAAPTVTNYTYNVANQMTNAGAATLTYDNNGNLTSDGTNAHTWDRANRLLSMGGVSYAYDGAGNRIRQTVGANVTRYLLDLQPGLAVVLAATTGATTNGSTEGHTDRYVHGQRGIHAQQLNSGAWQHTLEDGLGSVRAVVDNNLATLNQANYSAYGTPDAAIGSPFAFTGEQRDGSGLQYHRARYYAPGLGIFPSLDPFEGMAGRPMSLNGYSWVEGNVVNKTDPTGMFDWSNFTTEQYDSISCIAAEGGVPFQAYSEFERQVIAFSQYTAVPIVDPNYISIGQFIPVPNEVSANGVTISNIVNTGQSGYFRYASPCWLKRNSIPVQPVSTVTPSPSTSPMPTATCSAPTATPVPPRVITGGFRFDTTVIGPTGFGIDLNLEWHCAPYFGTCGWFLNMSGERSTTLPGAISGNINLGAVIGYMGWPQNVGDYSLTFTVGGNGGAFVTAWGIPLEGDFTVSRTGDVIVFIGAGIPSSATPSGYVAGGASIYFGSDLQNIPQYALDQARNTFDILLRYLNLQE